jgi:hypothetical protein
LLAGKHSYIVTILIEPLNQKLRNRKEYVKKTRVPIVSKYMELLYDAFFAEFGDHDGNRLFGEWLEKYRPLFKDEYRARNPNAVDEYIVEHELEPRYKDKILARFKNHDKLIQERHATRRERHYGLPEPLKYIDWRNPFDNIFVWEENGAKIARRGGSGSSGAREMNSMFIYGLLELNKTQPVPSYLFVYSENNELLFVEKFNSLCVPSFGIGANYDQMDRAEEARLEHGSRFLQWGMLGRIPEVQIVHK